MKTSARNCFEGKVAKIVEGAINDEITVSLPGGKEVVAVITKGSTRRLGLAEGKDVLALIKASFVILLDDADGYAFSIPVLPARYSQSPADSLAVHHQYYIQHKEGWAGHPHQSP